MFQDTLTRAFESLECFEWQRERSFYRWLLGIADNLILDAERRLRILDFGLAHLEGQESLTASGDFLVTRRGRNFEDFRAEAEALVSAL